LTTTIAGAFPEIVAPDFTTELDTSTPMYAGTVTGGAELAPGAVVQVMPQAGGVAPRFAAKPLKASGAAPPLRTFLPDHSLPQKVTRAGGALIADYERAVVEKREEDGGCAVRGREVERVAREVGAHRTGPERLCDR
jgi:hypothetical protein